MNLVDVYYFLGLFLVYFELSTDSKIGANILQKSFSISKLVPKPKLETIFNESELYYFRKILYRASLVIMWIFIGIFSNNYKWFVAYIFYTVFVHFIYNNIYKKNNLNLLSNFINFDKIMSSLIMTLIILKHFYFN